jgi:hypothetical protein
MLASLVMKGAHAMQKNSIAFITAMLSNIKEREELINSAEAVRHLLCCVLRGFDMPIAIAACCEKVDSAPEV